MIFYGEEIGMGELSTDLGRGAVRGPMQWDAGPLGGFTTSTPSKLRRPVAGGAYAPAHVNVHDQRRDPESLWSFIATLASRYRSTPEIAWGDLHVQDPGDPRVLAHQTTYGDVTFIAVHNLSAEPVTARLEPLAEGRTVTVLLESSGSAPQGEHTEQLLDGYGFRWFRVSPDAWSAA